MTDETLVVAAARVRKAIEIVLAERREERAYVVQVLPRVAGDADDVRTLLDGAQPAGRGSVTWDGMSDAGERATSGVYFYRLSAQGETRTDKMLLLK